MNKKIIICANSSWNLTNFRAGLILALVDSGYDVVALAPRDAATANVEALGCRFVELPMSPTGTGVFSNLRLFLRFLRVLRHERPDYFLGFTIKPNILGSLAARSLAIRHINNITGLGSVFAKPSPLMRLTVFLYSFALAKSSCVFFQNPDDRSLFAKLGILTGLPIDVLPGSGVNLDHFKCRTPDARKPANNTAGVTSFILVSRMLRDKGVFEFYEAACILRGAGVAAEFKLLGPTAEGREGVPLAVIKDWHDKGVVTYLGKTDDVRAFVLDSDCVVLPTFYREGVPRALIEAAAMGRPLIATDVAGCREIVIDKKNGYLCAPRSASDLATKMQLFVDQGKKHKEQMGRSSRALVEQRFDETIVIDKYLDRLVVGSENI